MPSVLSGRGIPANARMCPAHPQGLDVVHAVSRAAVGVATHLDSAIEQLMEGWVSPLDRGSRRRSGAVAARCTTVATAEGSARLASEQHGILPLKSDGSGDMVSLPVGLMHCSPSCLLTW